MAQMTAWGAVSSKPTSSDTSPVHTEVAAPLRHPDPSILVQGTLGRVTRGREHSTALLLAGLASPTLAAELYSQVLCEPLSGSGSAQL